MFMDWKSQYCKGVNCLQMDLQIPCNPIKITKGYLTEFSKLTLKCIQKCEDPRIAKIMLKNKTEGPTLSDLQTY